MYLPVRRTVFSLVFVFLLFTVGAAAGDRDAAKPLSTTVVLEFSIGGQTTTVATAKSRFAIVGTFSEEHRKGKEHFGIEVVVDLGGAITQGKGDKPWLVELHGTFSFDESLVETRESPNGPIREQATTHLKITLENSVYLRPGERTLIASQSDQTAWLTLRIPAQP